MRGGVAIHGLEARQGETAFAFLVLRLARPMERAELVEVVRHVAPMIPDAAGLIAGFSDELDEAMRIVGMPWAPPERDGLDEQRALIEGAAERGVEAAWFFQAGTSLPSVEEDEDDEDDEGDEDGAEVWSHGPPPQRIDVPFPVDGYPEILEELDWEDFGISFKLAGPFTPGENTVLLGFHALWLSPYGERYRNAAVTIDRRHHAAHLWVDRFAVPCSPEEQVGHLLWVLSKLHEVTPVLHARFGGATMAQKYGGLMGDTSEPFVLGGNPLIAVYAEDGEAGVDLWSGEQTDWSDEEVAHMLRELADRIVAGGSDEAEPGDADGEGEEDDGEYEEADEDGDYAEEGDDGGEDELDVGENEDENEDEDEGDADADEDRGRYIATYAGELLIARARAGVLDPRAADALRPLLATAEKYERRRTAVVGILGALGDRASLPAMIQLLEETRIADAADAIGKEDLLSETASALGALADPAAIPALSKLAAAPGPHNDRPRPAAAAALAACLAAAPEPRDVDDAVVRAMLEAIGERAGGELAAEVHLAYGLLAQQLPPPRRDDLRRRLAEAAPARDDSAAKLARHAALALASRGGALEAEAAAAMRPLVHAALTEQGHDHESTLRNIRIALRVAELLPELAAPADLVELTRLPEQEVRARAHALLARLHHGMPPARCFDARAARALADDELVAQAGDPHVVGRAALVGEIARRGLTAGLAAVRAAVRAAIDRAPPGERALLAPDERLFELAIPWLREGELEDDTIALFDRILRHGNPHVKWELLQAPPADDRLIGGMFYVLSERWGWQEGTARDWLRRLEGTALFEAARRRAGVASLDPSEDAEAAALGDEEVGDDAMN